jgi:hypothetical protein
LVGNDSKWFFSLAAQQSSKKSFRGALITARLNQNVDHVAVLIHGTPQILCCPLIRMKTSSKCEISSRRPSRRFSFRVRTELLTPGSNRFIRDDDSEFGEKSQCWSQKAIGISNSQREAAQKAYAHAREVTASWHPSLQNRSPAGRPGWLRSCSQ